MAMAQEFEFEPWPPDDVGKSRTPNPPPGPKGGASRIHCTLRRPRAQKVLVSRSVPILGRYCPLSIPV